MAQSRNAPMKKTNFEEPIFYFSGDQSTFLNAQFLTPNFIVLKHSSVIPQQFGRIEFCLPNSKKVISVNYELKFSSTNELLLSFLDLTKTDQGYLLDFCGVNKQEFSRKNSEFIESTFN